MEGGTRLNTSEPDDTLRYPVRADNVSSADRIYIHSIHGEDWSAFADLVEPLRGSLLNCVGLLIGDFDEAASIAQEAFVRGWSSRHKLVKETMIYPWLRAIAVNLAKQTLERRRTRAFVSDLNSDAMASQISTSQPSLLSELVKDELMLKMSMAISQLPEAYREAVVLHYLEGMDYESIAQLTGTTSAAIRARAVRAKHLLKGSLGRIVDTWMRQASVT